MIYMNHGDTEEIYVKIYVKKDGGGGTWTLTTFNGQRIFNFKYVWNYFYYL